MHDTTMKMKSGIKVAFHTKFNFKFRKGIQPALSPGIKRPEL